MTPVEALWIYAHSPSIAALLLGSYYDRHDETQRYFAPVFWCASSYLM
jgi:hypothetical protein